jgi:transposase-like protein
LLLTKDRDEQAAKRFLTKAIRRHGVPEKITIDGSAAHEAAPAGIQEISMTTQNSKASNEAQIRQLIADWGKALHAKDLNTLMACYTYCISRRNLRGGMHLRVR